MRTLTGSLVLLVVAASNVFAQTPRTPEPPPGVKIERDVDYLGPGREEKADLYLPAAPAEGERRPAVLIIHGGGWTGGDKAAAREFNIGTNLVQRGYVAMSINYLLSKDGKTTWPQNLHDCKTAVRWLRKNADRLGIDPDRIGVIGGSAGGHLSAMVGLTGPSDGLDPAGPYGEFPCKVQCAVVMYGPADLFSRPNIAMLGKPSTEAPELYRAASPVTHVDRDDPPVLVLHGTADKTVDVEQSRILDAALAKAGIEHELVIVEGAPHSFHLQPKQRDLRPVVIGFFDRHLKGEKASSEK